MGNSVVGSSNKSSYWNLGFLGDDPVVFTLGHTKGPSGVFSYPLKNVFVYHSLHIYTRVGRRYVSLIRLDSIDKETTMETQSNLWSMYFLILYTGVSIRQGIKRSLDVSQTLMTRSSFQLSRRMLNSRWVSYLQQSRKISSAWHVLGSLCRYCLSPRLTVSVRDDHVSHVRFDQETVRGSLWKFGGDENSESRLRNKSQN